MMALNHWLVTRWRIAEGAFLTIKNCETPNRPLFFVALMSMDLEKANLSTESHKTLGFTILDRKMSHEPHIGVCQKYTAAYGSQRLLLEVPRAVVQRWYEQLTPGFCTTMAE